MFAGTFSRCVDKFSNDITSAKITNKSDCLTNGYFWEPFHLNFDNLGNALLSLLHVASMDGWKRLMKQAVDAQGVYKLPYIHFI